MSLCRGGWEGVEVGVKKKKKIKKCEGKRLKEVKKVEMSVVNEKTIV